MQPQRERLPARIAAAPDLTARAVRAELQERSIKISCRAVWSLLPAEQERPDVADAQRVIAATAEQRVSTLAAHHGVGRGAAGQGSAMLVPGWLTEPVMLRLGMT